MPDFYFNYEGRGRERTRVDCATLADARNEAVRHLGAFLTQHPDFASEGHWRVNVEDNFGKVLLHVIVATVMTGGAPAPA